VLGDVADRHIFDQRIQGAIFGELTEVSRIESAFKVNGGARAGRDDGPGRRVPPAFFRLTALAGWRR
jgi:hypothetical protein